ncbi:hypothetical protein CGRA01v4_14280 [Colletotrichum graminicola]|uniref:ABM domain-containing protein n=1 Tax=Colletotrichum graminicola (strain M1.001 / M2 / FGSC 10212) TaxID=645133 RepID=E3Q5A8_COLGM|nr:uncharacterized protein GLRG_01019 [Colletotrichum graminicola M1.001]EFQ25875.1 hypothetical protein GLRG_01019 [Colletotrichum graminicola M1.001]WDK22989.1 hypothetical protein CGRA01v4_14280 [Colletotrichum graminicola]
MAFCVVITPKVRADKKEEFLAAWPKVKEEISKQPGVVRVAGGQVVNESGTPVTEFKYIQTIVFNSEADEKAFAESAWVKDHKAESEKFCDGPPRIAKFETGPLHDEKSKAFAQFAFLNITDESKHEEAKQAWQDLAAALGQTPKFGGRGIGDEQSTGMGVLGWDSEDEAGAAYTKPEAQAALQKYKSFGKDVAVLVKLEA